MLSKGKNRKYMTIKIALLQDGMTYGELAKTLGISISAVSKKLAGKSDWNLQELVIMSKKFGKSIDELIA